MTTPIRQMSPLEERARAILHGRYDDAFPTLTGAEIVRLKPLGTNHQYKDGEALFLAGKASPGLTIILGGRVILSARDALGRVNPIVEVGAGQFLGELSALGGDSPQLVDAHAEGE